jgi:phosphomannomutase
MHHECTLTGFKHLGNLAWRLEREEGKKVLFAFEEAIGFMVGTTVFEKDGLSALLLAYYLVDSLDCSLSQYLMAVYGKYGPCVQYNSYYFCQSRDIPTVFSTIRARLLDHRCGDLNIVKDYAPANMISMEGGDSLSITLRTSGTEPKIKFYSEMQTDSVFVLKRKILGVLESLFEGLPVTMKDDDDV